MTKSTHIAFSAVFFLALLAGLPGRTMAQEPTRFIPDKALCEKMIRSGKEAYSRGKYLDAKEYFRKAVQADPGSKTAWRYYDQAVIFALAERVERNSGLTLPGVSQRQEPARAVPPPAPAAKKPQEKESGFTIEEDEGC
jgi:tetratricopeptide (TPR) repeat protein